MTAVLSNRSLRANHFHLLQNILLTLPRAAETFLPDCSITNLVAHVMFQVVPEPVTSQRHNGGRQTTDLGGQHYREDVRRLHESQIIGQLEVLDCILRKKNLFPAHTRVPD